MRSQPFYADLHGHGPELTLNSPSRVSSSHAAQIIYAYRDHEVCPRFRRRPTSTTELTSSDLGEPTRVKTDFFDHFRGHTKPESF
jgi:hypothetical protein